MNTVINIQDHFKGSNAAATISTQDLAAELEKRQLENVFPIDVFHKAIQPYMQALIEHLDLPRAYVGLSMLTAYSSAIGTSYAVKQSQNLTYLPIWGCLEGISSSGKSLAMDMILKPLYSIQEKYDREWKLKQDDDNLSREDLKYERLMTAVVRDVHISTLVRSVMPDNPKGVTKIADEILEWINGMNQLSRKEGTDEQFYLSAWNCRPYSGIRSGKEKFSIPRPFINVVGGIQPTIMYKLFKNDRDTTGFIFRLLFAVPEKVKIAQPDSSYVFEEELEQIHTKRIEQLYKALYVENEYDDPRMLIMDRQASKALETWRRMRISKINHMRDVRDMEIHSGILGKISEYARRFAGILHVSDLAYNHHAFEDGEISEQTMDRALRLADYFYESAATVYERVNTTVVAPAEVLRLASMVKAGYSYAMIGEKLYERVKITDNAKEKRAERLVKKAIQDYPKVFGAKND